MDMNPNYEEATMALNFKPEDMSGENSGRQVWGDCSASWRKDRNTRCDQRPHARNAIIWRWRWLGWNINEITLAIIVCQNKSSYELCNVMVCDSIVLQENSMGNVGNRYGLHCFSWGVNHSADPIRWFRGLYQAAYRTKLPQVLSWEV